MARLRNPVLVCVLSVGMLAAVHTIAPVFAGVIPSEPSRPVHLYLPLVMQFNQVATDVPLISLADFIISVTNRSSQGIKGVYVPTIFAYHVVTQPAGNYAFVSPLADTVTEFGLTSAGVVGLLGHESLAGKAFSGLQPNQEVYLIWADGSTRKFTIASSHRYQALTPSSPSSDFIDLETWAQISAADLFVEYYMGSEHVILQTCITREGNPNWGRLFVVAEPTN